MALWTEFVTPAELTGYVRAAAEDYQASLGTLAAWLPNREVPDQVVRTFVGSSGLVDEARYRAFDAEPEMGRSPGGKRVTVDLPAISQTIPVSEYGQLRARNAPDSQIRQAIFDTAARTARAIVDRTERMRGTVLVTGKATIAQDNYASDVDFGRDADLSTTAGTLWSDPAADRLGFLSTLMDTYAARNNALPGAILGSRRIMRALTSGTQFATQLSNGASRPATFADVNGTLVGAGIPEFTVYERSTSGGRVIPDDRILLLPPAVGINDWQGTQLGATFWGQTLTGTDPDYGIAPVEQPGIVTGSFRNPKPPMIAEVISDAIACPILANGNLAVVAKVL